jgi:hypothetical protein
MMHADFRVSRRMKWSDHTVTLKVLCSSRQSCVQNLPKYADCCVEITCPSVGLLNSSVLLLYM